MIIFFSWGTRAHTHTHKIRLIFYKNQEKVKERHTKTDGLF